MVNWLIERVTVIRGIKLILTVFLVSVFLVWGDESNMGPGNSGRGSSGGGGARQGVFRFLASSLRSWSSSSSPQSSAWQEGQWVHLDRRPSSIAVPSAYVGASSQHKQSRHSHLTASGWSKKWKFTMTKQVVTLGPASDTRQMIEKFFRSGADVFRLNLSHGTREEKVQQVRLLRELEREWGHPIAVLADLQGPKQRVGDVGEGVELVNGSPLRFDLSPEVGNTERVPLPHPEVMAALRPGDPILLDDGKLRLIVTDKGDGFVNAEVIVGGLLKSKKGVNTPSVILPISAMSDKDRLDALAARDAGVDYIALSFVQRPQDVLELRNLVGPSVGIVSKIEKPQAVDQFPEICKVSDAIMVARGDLGVEMQPEDIPVVQKKMIDESRRQGKPIIVATQMLESMIDNPMPTRAEASDVATAIYDGADAVMLSAESAAGHFPAEAVSMQQRIIQRVEQDPLYWRVMQATGADPSGSTSIDAISEAARSVAAAIKAKAIVSFTVRGATVKRASRARPHVPILAISPCASTARQLQLYWGVYPIPITDIGDYTNSTAVDCHSDPITLWKAKGGSDGVTLPSSRSYDNRDAIAVERLVDKACAIATDIGLAPSPLDFLVVTAGLPFGITGATNLLRVTRAGGPDAWYPDEDLPDEAHPSK
eukprot:GHVN01095115.1.p1 GENE.GHVN01095115.1~~GHVN01095115.1.p1  ORF type:complete len:653 (+),score=119.16 GHVN01095115.1:54-2012(+)